MPIYCLCGRALTQPYAQKMGECVECCLLRIRRYRERPIFLTDKSKIAKSRDYQKKKRQDERGKIPLSTGEQR